jgi:hypothetical protein
MEFGIFKNLNSTLIWKDTCVDDICIFGNNIGCINNVDCMVNSELITSDVDKDVKIFIVFRGTDSFGKINN